MAIYRRTQSTHSSNTDQQQNIYPLNLIGASLSQIQSRHSLLKESFNVTNSVSNQNSLYSWFKQLLSINNLTKQSSVLACSFGLEEELMLENNLKNQLVDFFYNLPENSSLKKILGNIVDDLSLSKKLVDYSGKEIVSGVLTTLTDIYTFYLFNIIIKNAKAFKSQFCGTHIHFGIETFQQNTWHLSLNLLNRQQQNYVPDPIKDYILLRLIKHLVAVFYLNRHLLKSQKIFFASPYYANYNWNHADGAEKLSFSCPILYAQNNLTSLVNLLCPPTTENEVNRFYFFNLHALTKHKTIEIRGLSDFKAKDTPDEYLSDFKPCYTLASLGFINQNLLKIQEIIAQELAYGIKNNIPLANTVNAQSMEIINSGKWFKEYLTKFQNDVNLIYNEDRVLIKPEIKQNNTDTVTRPRLRNYYPSQT